MILYKFWDQNSNFWWVSLAFKSTLKVDFFENFHEKIKFPNFIKDHFYDVLACPGHQKRKFWVAGNHQKHQKMINLKIGQENDEI